jgi:hypothetical protein
MEYNFVATVIYPKLAAYLSTANGVYINTIADMIGKYDGWIKIRDVFSPIQLKNVKYDKEISLIKNVVGELHQYIIKNIQNPNYIFLYNRRDGNNINLLGRVSLEGDKDLFTCNYSNNDHLSVSIGKIISISCAVVDRIIYKFTICSEFSSVSDFDLKAATTKLKKIIEYQKLILNNNLPEVITSIVNDYSCINYTFGIINKSMKAGLQIIVNLYER